MMLHKQLHLLAPKQMVKYNVSLLIKGQVGMQHIAAVLRDFILLKQ